jgi:hypothetical protein
LSIKIIQNNKHSAAVLFESYNQIFYLFATLYRLLVYISDSILVIDGRDDQIKFDP